MLVNEVNAPRRFTDLKLEKEMTHSETGLVGRGGQRVTEYLGSSCPTEKPPVSCRTVGRFWSV